MNKYNEIEIKKEKKMLESGLDWNVRNEAGTLFVYYEKPSKVDGIWWAPGPVTYACEFVPIFQNIRFGDKEPVSLEAIVHPPILDDTEKQYLSAVIKPFRDRVKYIKITTLYDACECLDCFLYIRFNDGNYDMNFPVFHVGNMYKGMELDHEYTLEELGL